jgi:hypothetical protein
VTPAELEKAQIESMRLSALHWNGNAHGYGDFFRAHPTIEVNTLEELRLEKEWERVRIIDVESHNWAIK